MEDKKVQVINDPSSHQFCVEAARKMLDSELQNLMPTINKLRLREKIEYMLNTEGKRLRADLVVLSGQSVGGNAEKMQKLALAIELLHSASLVHDDILDRDMFRRNVFSVQAKWGVREAVLVGDALASLSLGLCGEYGKEIVEVMAHTCLQLSDGEYMDVETSNAALSEANYLEKVKKKSASLFKAAAQCGALVAEGSPTEVDCLARFGENYGLAFQIRDDIADIALLENDLPPDLNEFRITLPMIHLYETAGTGVQLLLERLLASKMGLSEKRFLLSELLINIGNSGSLLYCQSKIDLFVNRAIAELSGLKDTIYKTYLIEMAELLRNK